MKKRLALVAVSLMLAATMLFAVACSGGGNAGPSPSPTPGGGDNRSYTLNEWQPGSPDTWNPHTWESSTDNYILGYNTMALYDFALNSAKNGYDIVPEMAASAPVDVTKQFAGDATYRVPQSAESGYAFRIALNPSAKWENGDVINADTYVQSMQRMLDPKFVNRRADSFYSGMLVIANAKSYFKQLPEKVYSPVASADGYAAVTDDQMYVSVTEGLFFFGDYSLKQAYVDKVFGDLSEAFVIDGVDLYSEIAEACANSRSGMIPMTPEIKAWLIGVAANLDDGANEETYKQMTFYVSETTGGAEVSFDSVGIKKTSEFEITLILENPISEFYLYYNLASPWLVHIPTYDKLTTEISADYKRTKYNTTKDTTMSYGPYKLTDYIADKQIKLAKNSQWYGWTDGKHAGQYQTTNIVCEIIKEDTAFNRFLKGDFDNVTLGTDEYTEYRSSEYLSYVPESYTASMAINTDKAKLKSRERAGINKTLMSYQKFRKAISLSVDRVTFNNGINPVAGAGFGLLNDAYIADPDSGKSYRSYDVAKKVIVDLNEITYGAGAEYATLDEAYDSVTNYNKDKALQLFQEAFAEARQAGDWNGTDKVQIEYLVYASGDWELWATLVGDAINKVLAGTDLAGKVEIVTKVDQQFGDTMKAGSGDMARAMWGGSDMDPFSVAQLYLDPTLNYSYGFDGNAHSFAMAVNGTNYNMNLNEWFDALTGAQGAKVNFSQLPVDTKVEILAKIEYSVLNDFSTIPLYSRQTAQLFSKKIENATDTYLPLVGFGGIRFMTYKMDDVAWDAFRKNNSNMNYK